MQAQNQRKSLAPPAVGAEALIPGFLSFFSMPYRLLLAIGCCAATTSSGWSLPLVAYSPAGYQNAVGRASTTALLVSAPADRRDGQERDGRM